MARLHVCLVIGQQDAVKMARGHQPGTVTHLAAQDRQPGELQRFVEGLRRAVGNPPADCRHNPQLRGPGTGGGEANDFRCLGRVLDQPRESVQGIPKGLVYFSLFFNCSVTPGCQVLLQPIDAKFE